jgi:phenylpropionate dioxygenase-like ring-hydroxylating dioxygenase large terminal subunit
MLNALGESRKVFPTMNEAKDPWAHHWALASEAGIGAASVDAEQYFSPDIYQAECDKIFRRAWLLVARESELPQRGDFIKREVYPLKAQALIVRGKDNQIRAFHNSCPHRGAALVREPEGTKSLFVCPYHAWSFGADGRCIAITAAEYFPQVDKATIGLTPIRLEVWNGFIFLNFAVEPEQSLAEYLGAFGELYGEVPFHEFKYGIESVQDIGTNWKCLIDAFNESYHVGVLHKNTLPQIPTPTNPHGIYCDARYLAPHSSFITQSNPDWIPRGDVTKFVYSRVMHAKLRPAAADRERSGEAILAVQKNVNPLELPGFGLRLLNIFPMTQIQIFGDSYNVLQYWPLGPGRSRFILRRYARAAPASYFETFAEAYVGVGPSDVLAEDISMTEDQQLSLQSGGLRKVFFGEHETFPRFFHQVVENYMNG